ncbi:SAM-dependent methyltransferase [Candidatus Magnetobacterium casensis]|uniref:SAM-dependent methyltransferase n=2 Tax=Candidatus Magnetobacterium casense TaxID=1455061 RepID=A0ABS6S355_9BACT|nr:SAM-dependent methyltransferase [Candidatus Magnetobacterium casensis]
MPDMGIDIEAIIRDRIRREGGAIPFKEFMSMSLYYPGYGYYTGAATQIGRDGDYFTAPHLHPVFGALVARQTAEMWQLMGRPADFCVVEFGAGRGYLAADVLGYLRGDEFYDALTYLIIELNPYVQRQQERLLAPFADKVRWVSAATDVAPLRGCVLSNELIDAFPVHMITMVGDGDDALREVWVDEGFGEVLHGCSDDIRAYVREFGLQLCDGYRTEVNLALRDWLREVSGMLLEGFVFTIDYGYPAWQYYSAQRTRGTLVCYSGHRVSDNPYANVGGQDITAHVNFTALKRWGEAVGLVTVGFAPQGTFMVSMGIDDLLTGMLTSGQYQHEVAQVKRLLLPQGMGESHKVLIQYKGSLGNPALRGFSLRNQRAALEG